MTASLPFPPFDNAVLGIMPEPGKLDELHLYHGSRCNRACAFCCVFGDLRGSYIPFHEEVLRAAVRTVARHGSLKIYGGEPTMDAENLRWALRRLRALGFEGAVTIFSNGLKPKVLTGALAMDPGVRVVLNYAIATGTGEESLPPRALAHLCAYHAAKPGRIFLSHDFVVPVGRQPERPGVTWNERLDGSEAPTDAGEPRPLVGCFRCYPTLTTAGHFHACPFAVEYDRPHYALGDTETPPETVRARFTRFLRWIDECLTPEAERQGRNACAVCVGTASPIPDSIRR